MTPHISNSAFAVPTFGKARKSSHSPGSTSSEPNSEMQVVLDQLAKLGGKPVELLDAPEARKQPTPADAVGKLMKRLKIKQAEVAHVKNRTIDGPAGDIKLRIYTPDGDGPFPVIVYYHGGGFVIANLDVYDSTPRALSNAVKAIVVSSHYRQGPEDKFPAAHEDAFAAYKWVIANISENKGDRSRVAVAGESAGGNLAIAVSVMARDQKIQMPIHQLLVYPVAGSDMETPSYLENENAKPLNKAMMKWFVENETVASDLENPLLIPLKGELSGLPSTTLIAAQIDPLRSEGELLAKQLDASGVHVEYKCYDGVTHEFFGMGAVVAEAREAIAFAAAKIKGSFSSNMQSKDDSPSIGDAPLPNSTPKPFAAGAQSDSQFKGNGIKRYLIYPQSFATD